MNRLPADVLGGILDRLPLPSLAVSRCVCREWRAAIEARRSLFLPRSLHGIFINYDYGDNDGEHSRLLSRPGDPTGAGAFVDGAMGFVPRERDIGWRRRYFRVLDHCNGLLLYSDETTWYYVCNPATQRWAPLPEPTRLELGTATYFEIDPEMYLAFDPTVSPHYDVVRFRGLLGPNHYDERRNNSREARRRVAAAKERRASTEWPPAVLGVDVFSSATGRWEERQLVREGGAVATIADINTTKRWPKKVCDGPRRWYAEYWEGALYVHVRGSYLLRFSLSDNTCKAITTPIVPTDGGRYCSTTFTEHGPDFYLGRSEKGIYFVTLVKRQIWVWSLNETSVSMEWVLRHHSNLVPLSRTLLDPNIQLEESWIFEDYDSGLESDDDNNNEVDRDSDDEDNGSEVNDDEDHDNYQHNSDNSSGNEEDSASYEEEEEDNVEQEDDVDQGNSEWGSDNGWNSDDDYNLDIKNCMDHPDFSDLYFFGFHPYKEIVFLGEYCRVVAYHLGRCKAQYLGYCRPCRFYSTIKSVMESFPYTPCFIDSLPIRNSG